MIPEIEPCPVCSSGEVSWVKRREWFSDVKQCRTTWFVSCNQCGEQSRITGQGFRRAIELWNTEGGMTRGREEIQ